MQLEPPALPDPTRAIAWFADMNWPYSGIEPDNFLRCGPFKPMKGSHLCNHSLWIQHIVYKSAEENQDRKV